MELTYDLNTLWFFLVGILLTGYAILDGFDLGVGMLHLWVKGDKERRIMINAIGPLLFLFAMGIFPNVVISNSYAGVFPDHLQCCQFLKNTGNHGHYCGNRHPFCVGLYILYLLGF